jgi:branched-chain amino acid transport system ATP-binding protein
MKPVLQIEGLGCNLGARAVLQGIDLQLEQGQCLAVIGPNGAGKSTLFNVISGLLVPSRGDVRLMGRSIVGRSPEQIARSGLARSFQSSHLFAAMSVADHLRCGALRQLAPQAGGWRGMLGSLQGVRGLQRRVDSLLEALDLADCAHCLASGLSYAQQRYLELGLVLASEPDVMLLDEPTAGLSRSETKKFIERLRRLTAGRSVLLVEHDLSVVDELADSVLVMQEGRVLAHGTAAQVRSDGRVQAVYPLPQRGASDAQG